VRGHVNKSVYEVHNGANIYIVISTIQG